MRVLRSVLRVECSFIYTNNAFLIWLKFQCSKPYISHWRSSDNDAYNKFIIFRRKCANSYLSNKFKYSDLWNFFTFLIIRSEMQVLYIPFMVHKSWITYPKWEHVQPLILDKLSRIRGLYKRYITNIFTYSYILKKDMNHIMWYLVYY